MAVVGVRPPSATLPGAQRAGAPFLARRRSANLWESTISACEALAANKIRSLLTMLGIIIGVGAVIVMMAIGTGAQADVAARMRGLGTNVLQIEAASINIGGAQAGAGTRRTLTEADAVAIRDGIAGISAVSPFNDANGTQVVAGNQNWNTRITGAYPGIFTINHWDLAAGRFYDDADEATGRAVAVIGKTVADNLFLGADPIGQPIRIGQAPFTVVGVLAPKGQTGFRDQDDIVYIPLKAANRRVFSQQFVTDILVEVATADKIPSVQAQMEALLHQRHRLNGPQNDFRIRNRNDIVQTAEGVARTMSYLLAGVAGVSLLVGGIGIMNIMLVSVTERTREIGIRMAIGARMRDVLSQFLIEAVALSTLGGAVGIVLGLGSARLLTAMARWTTIITPQSILVSFGFAALVGVFFGFYPARKASQLDPIEALRYE